MIYLSVGQHLLFLLIILSTNLLIFLGCLLASFTAGADTEGFGPTAAVKQESAGSAGARETISISRGKSGTTHYTHRNNCLMYYVAVNAFPTMGVIKKKKGCRSSLVY